VDGLIRYEERGTFANAAVIRRVAALADLMVDLAVVAEVADRD
jgi:hypothetical protein